MKRSILRFCSVILILCMAFGFVSCGQEVIPTTTFEPACESTTAVEEVTQDETEPEATEEPGVVVINPLTGKECDPSLQGKRPIAVMFNNLKDALPQIGLSHFDVIYEVLAEGGILRLEAFTLDYKGIEKIGSVRSARPYYVELSTAYDAIYVHAGRSDLAATKIKSMNINNVNGVEGPGNGAFYRDQDRLKNGYATEHTLFTSGSNIAGAIEQLKYRTDLENKDLKVFAFNSAFTSLNSGKSAKYIKIPHSSYSVSEFNYNESDGLYYHKQYGKDHVDGENNQKIAVENVFVIFAKHGYNSDGKTRNITLTGEGAGYYMTGGEVVSITWKRAAENGTFSYYLEDGTELSVRPGKTYVSVADIKIQSKVTIS